MKERTIKKKRISKDCWDMDYAFFKWLNERLPVYLKQAGKIVDLDYHQIEYNGKMYTQRELIEYLIKLVDKCSSKYIPFTQEEVNRVHEAVEVWKQLILFMWW